MAEAFNEGDGGLTRSDTLGGLTRPAGVVASVGLQLAVMREGARG